jgi:hypothetical protein
MSPNSRRRTRSVTGTNYNRDPGRKGAYIYSPRGTDGRIDRKKAELRRCSARSAATGVGKSGCDAPATCATAFRSSGSSPALQGSAG